MKISVFGRELNVAEESARDVNKDLAPKDQEKDKDLTPRTRTRTRT